MQATSRSSDGATRAAGKVHPGLVLLLGAIALLYFYTLYPGVGGRGNPGDSAKFQYIGLILGVPHQPGYPQYLLLSHLWSRLPIPMELAARLNLLSSLFSLAAGAFLFLFVRRLSGSGRAAALATATVLLGRVVWTFSTEAEVYSLNLLYLCAVLWAAEHWRSSRDWRWLAAVVAIYGLSFGNHPLMITLLPGLLVLLAATDLRALFRPRTLGFAALILALTLAQYGLLVWRANSGVEVVEGISRGAELGDLTRTLRAERFTGEYMLREGWGTFFLRWAETAGEVIEQTAIVGLVLAVLGFGYLLRRLPVRGWFLLLAAAVTALFAALYQIGDWRLYLAPVFVAVAAAAAVGSTRALESARDRRVAQIAWLLAVVVMAWGNASALAIDPNPWDRALVLDAAPPGTRVVTYAGPSYATTQMNRYYRLGLGLEEAREIEILTGSQLFERFHGYLEDEPIVFRHPRVKQQFDRYRVDYVERFIPGDPENRYVFETGVRYPVDHLVAVPAEGGLSVETEDGKVLAEPAAGGRVIVIGTRDRRVKGVVPLYAPPSAAVPEPLGGLGLLRRVRPEDWVAVLFEGVALAPENRPVVHKVADFLGIDPAELPRSAGALLLAEPPVGSSDGARVVADPPGPVRLAVSQGGEG